jgi:hypothetical protein
MIREHSGLIGFVQSKRNNRGKCWQHHSGRRVKFVFLPYQLSAFVTLFIFPKLDQNLCVLIIPTLLTCSKSSSGGCLAALVQVRIDVFNQPTLGLTLKNWQ